MHRNRNLLLFGFIVRICSEAFGYDVNVSNSDYPVTPVGNIGWDPGMTHARAIHWSDAPFYQYWVSCPDDAQGCSTVSTADPQYAAAFDIDGSQEPGHPNSNELVYYPGIGVLPCPLYADWYGFAGARDYSTGINNYSWNIPNSPNIWTGLSQGLAFWNPATQQIDPNPRLDQVLLAVNLLAYLSRTYIQDGIAPRGQGRILTGFVFHGANGRDYVIEMNLSNMRVNLNDGRNDWAPEGVSNPWRDDIWAEYIYGNGYSAYVLGARNPSWGYNFVEGQQQTVFFDPWWVVTSLVWRVPSTCPQALDTYGNPTGSDVDPGGYGIILCGADASRYGLPLDALYVNGDPNGEIGATFDHAYIGVEMGGSAVYGNADIS